MRIDIPAIRNAASGQSCVCCGADDGTVVAAHYQGYRSSRLGKGQRIKPDDLFVAYLCKKCHAAFDGYQISTYEDPFMRKIDHSEQFMFWILKTWQRLYREGRIKFT